MKARKRPIDVRVWRFQKNEPIPVWVIRNAHDLGDGNLSIMTREGALKAYPGDWIIEGVQGEIYPCANDIFHTTYEIVGDA